MSAAGLRAASAASPPDPATAAGARVYYGWRIVAVAFLTQCLQATVIGECFGRPHYGAIAGRMTPVIVLAQAMGVPLVGWLRDRTGGYGSSVVLIAGLALLAALAISRLRPAAQPTSGGASRV